MVLLGYLCENSSAPNAGLGVSIYSSSDVHPEITAPTDIPCSKEIMEFLDVSGLTCNQSCYEGSAEGLAEGTNSQKHQITQTEKKKKKKCFTFYLASTLWMNLHLSKSLTEI